MTPKLTILDVGHGNSAILQGVTGTVLIDAGRRNSVLEYLREEGITTLDLILISHADEDHIGGLLAILSSGMFKLGRVRLNTDSLKGSAIWDDLLYELDHLHQIGGVDFEPVLTQNDIPIFDEEDLKVEILAPSRYLAGKGPGSNDTEGRKISTNCISAVIRVHKGDLPIALFPGDLDELGLDHLIATGFDFSAEFLVFPHHGGRSQGGDLSAFAERFCNTVQPKTVVFSTGRTRFSNPQPEVVAGIRRSGKANRIACTQLSKRCALDLPNSNPPHLAPVFANGKQARQCCAGTLVIDLSEKHVNMLPIYDAHQEFISQSAPTALCRLQFQDSVTN